MRTSQGLYTPFSPIATLSPLRLRPNCHLPPRSQPASRSPTPPLPGSTSIRLFRLQIKSHYVTIFLFSKLSPPRTGICPPQHGSSIV
ncbi:hypothetical protein B0T21DRAFT_373357 [Apiosordaria backusii]|uniref:Uncharacterized protein n=1 Tax=Apiosordaria backusii TaxID=314023 RepID=A0AA40AST7_9PEZI|nr:hypothetical protein B0T21DRAFT_373357 [Apiosordaria backusii]